MKPQPMPMTPAVTATALASYLRSAGVRNVGRAIECGDVADGDIDLGGIVSVQVGRGYACVCRWVQDGEAMLSGPRRKDGRELIADIREALAAARPEVN